MPGALSGIKVIDAGILVQGPQCAAYLQTLGAEVIKIELPNFGDQSRYIFLSEDDYRSAYFNANNRGKKSLTLDLRSADGAEILKQLIIDTDVLISNFKPGTMESWGLGYDDLVAQNPGLIWAAGSTFGPVGPDSDREGADLAAQCAGGLVSTTGLDGDPPSPVGVTIADHIASLNMTCGILAALQARHETGRGQKVEVSLLGGQIWAQASELTHFLMTNEVPGRANFGHPLIRSPYRIFETADGWLGLIGVPAGSFDQFLIALDRIDLMLDERFLQPGFSAEKRKWFFEELAKTFKTEPRDHWCRIFREIGIRYAPVNDYADVADDKGVWENDYLQTLSDSQGNPINVVNPPVRLSESELAKDATAPPLGQHTEEILKELGISDSQIEDFRARGVI